MVSRTIIPKPWSRPGYSRDMPLSDMPSTASVMSGPGRSMYAQRFALIHAQSDDGHSIYLPGVDEGLKSGMERPTVRPRRGRRQPKLLGQGLLLQLLRGR